MISDSTHLVVATFHEEKTAKDAFKSLKKAKRNKELNFEDAAVVRRDDKSRLHIQETGDVQPGEGAAIAGVLGAALGLLAGPAGVVLGGALGAMIGAVASASDTGISDYRLENIGDRLKPGTSAILAVASSVNIEEVEQFLLSHGADVISQDIDPDIASLMGAGDE
ncbi:MAG: DUF1269 domain-containing protein [Candidatus Promineifilaceae bacterium]